MASIGKSNPSYDNRTTQSSKASGTPPNGQTKVSKSQAVGYTSEGVKDNDIFSLPSSDWQLLSFITILGALVRLFRLSQPSSVVFDEVQYALSNIFQPQAEADPYSF
jgi:dolichyl-phosphate-mannose-protein mannosyltransferase